MWCPFVLQVSSLACQPENMPTELFSFLLVMLTSLPCLWASGNCILWSLPYWAYSNHTMCLKHAPTYDMLKYSYYASIPCVSHILITCPYLYTSFNCARLNTHILTVQLTHMLSEPHVGFETQFADWPLLSRTLWRALNGKLTDCKHAGSSLSLSVHSLYQSLSLFFPNSPTLTSFISFLPPVHFIVPPLSPFFLAFSFLSLSLSLSCFSWDIF